MERLRRELAHLLDRLGVDAAVAASGLRSEVIQVLGDGRRHVGDRVAADVAGAAVPDPVDRAERGDVGQLAAVLAVAEAQDRAALVVDLRDEVLVERAAVEEVGHRAPVLDVDRRRDLQRHRRQDGAHVAGRGQCRSTAKRPVVASIGRVGARISCVSGARESCRRPSTDSSSGVLRSPRS